MKNIFTFLLFIVVSFSQLNASNHPNQRIKAVIFDFDGTLVDTESVLCDAWKFAYRQQGYDLLEEEYWDLISQHKIAGNPQASLFMAKLGSIIINKECHDELLRDVAFYVADVNAKGLYPPIKTTLNFLCELVKLKQELGIKIALASGNNRKHIFFHLRNLGIENYFDVILSGSDDLSDYHDPEGTNKPKPYIYQKVAKLLGVLPCECIAIEDSGTGVTSALSAGCITLAIPNRASANHDFSSVHLKIESLSGIEIGDFFEMMTHFTH